MPTRRRSRSTSRAASCRGAAVTSALQEWQEGAGALRLFPNARMCGQCSYGGRSRRVRRPHNPPRRARRPRCVRPLRAEPPRAEQQQPPHRQCVPAVRLVRADDQRVADVERRPRHAGRRRRRGVRGAPPPPRGRAPPRIRGAGAAAGHVDAHVPGSGGCRRAPLGQRGRRRLARRGGGAAGCHARHGGSPAMERRRAAARRWLAGGSRPDSGRQRRILACRRRPSRSRLASRRRPSGTRCGARVRPRPRPAGVASRSCSASRSRLRRREQRRLRRQRG